MNLPNKLTLLRIILVVPFIILLMYGYNIAALVIFAIASITDFFDGYIARKYNLITDFGKLMDPLADKILVLAALILFVELKYIPAWVVIIILSREFFVTGIRIIASAKGDVIPADKSGKYKTVTQMIAIIIILIFTNRTLDIGNSKIFLAHIIISVPLFFTIWSGIEYYKKSTKYFK